MNANELADELNKYKGIATRDAATMLRQQQVEIEALKQNIGQLVKPALKIEEVMSENCTCYKLGYSQLNNYRKVNNENNNEAA